MFAGQGTQSYGPCHHLGKGSLGQVISRESWGWSYSLLNQKTPRVGSGEGNILMQSRQLNLGSESSESRKLEIIKANGIIPRVLEMVLS